MVLAPQLDPAVIIAIFSAALQSVQTWFQVKDSKKALQAFDKRYNASNTDPQVRREADALIQTIPSDILELMAGRVIACWDGYREVLKGDYLPSEVDKATESVQSCLCRELSRIYKLTGSIPEGELRKWWDMYCNKANRVM